MNEITTVLRPNSFTELVQFAKMAATSDLMPRDFRGKPENIMLAVQLGSEVGLSPMQAIQNISVINGRPTLWGDAMLALVRRDPRCQNVTETIEGEGDAMEAVCVVERRGADAVTARFSAVDAKRAGLWSKPGPWQQYPARMLQMRARGFALRDAFPDVLKGLSSAEEARDIPADMARKPGDYAGPTLEAEVEAPSDARQAINDAVPMRAAAAATPRAARVYEKPADTDERPEPERTDEQWHVWVDKLRAACAVLYRRAEVVELGNRPSVGKAIATGPDWVRRDVSAILAENYARFPEEPDDLDEVHIVGEEKVMSG